MKTILYATDYSENSVSALQLAITFAQKFDANLIVMHVFDIPISLASTVSVSYMKKEKRLFVEHRTKLKEFLIQHLGANKAMDVNYVVDEDGSVSDGILETALNFHADLICVGSKGASAAKEFLLGSTAKALLKKAPCPLFVVPADREMAQLHKMVYATDFERADIYGIKKLVKIAQKFGAQIRVVHITSKKEYAGEERMEWFKEMLQEKVDYAQLEFDLIFSDTVFEELMWYVEDCEADLLAMLERKDSTFYQRYLQPDLVRKMAKKSTIPLLSFKVGVL